MWACCKLQRKTGNSSCLPPFTCKYRKKPVGVVAGNNLGKRDWAQFGTDAIFLHRMARTASFLPQLALRLRAYQWRRVGTLAASSLALSLVLVLYLFGVSDHFFSRLFTAFFVGFWLLAATFLAIIPFISWATTHWFGRGWEPEAKPARAAASKPATNRPVSKAPAGRRAPSQLP